jgi:hypothetical protein
MKNPKLYYYVIDHCHEFAPTSFLRHCILVHRRFGGEGGRRKVVELAQAGAWILGMVVNAETVAEVDTSFNLFRQTRSFPFGFISDMRES